ncbi:immunoglobulin G-endopeptidase (IdeS)-like fusion protein with lipoprotein LppA [[Mycoplasma] phocae]|uniref:Immunoglobulin G-endopeptidase (IdeS)-like fusion protein with lipoprotein LppA n=1 Tax=[Mycoplasma] phocae TaxID=142651 RepID=A0A2Z5IQF0_9BACT|nr:IdeS/Mac family cysteine endopeptidase [[Mycoplasma] phocae]AXE60900.1 immunoglobulin G-endopeptidase (IdeS)-like fusion protein with lipoprotein LppA [[Mycoplasma] phocae]
MKKTKYLILSTILLTPLTAVACVNVKSTDKKPPRSQLFLKKVVDKSKDKVIDVVEKSNQHDNPKENKGEQKSTTNSNDQSQINNENNKETNQNISDKNLNSIKTKNPQILKPENQTDKKDDEINSPEKQTLPNNVEKNDITPEQESNNTEEVIPPTIIDQNKNDASENNESNSSKNDNKIHDLDLSKLHNNTNIIESLKYKVAETLWVAGVNVDVQKFKSWDDPEVEKFEYPLKGSEKEGWYDINKEFKGGDLTLCSAVVAANMIHWWIDYNKEYVDRYIKEYPENATIKAGEIVKKLQTIKVNYPDADMYYDKSRIFEYFKGLFANRAVWPDKLIDMFINGYKYSSEKYLNSDSQYSPNATRGFLKDVFGKQRLTDMVSPGSLDHLSNIIRKWINEDRALAVSYGTGRGAGHIVNIWGADFDKNGKVLAVYISDSDNRDDTMIGSDGIRQRVGMTRLPIDYSSGYAKLNAYKKPGLGVNIWNIYSIQNGKQIWKSFFDAKDKETLK